MPKVSRLRLRETCACVSVAEVVRLWTLAFGSIIHAQSLTTSATGDVRVYECSRSRKTLELSIWRYHPCPKSHDFGYGRRARVCSSRSRKTLDRVYGAVSAQVMSV